MSLTSDRLVWLPICVCATVQWNLKHARPMSAAERSMKNATSARSGQRTGPSSSPDRGTVRIMHSISPCPR
jgi:hypothetical protein